MLKSGRVKAGHAASIFVGLSDGGFPMLQVIGDEPGVNWFCIVRSPTTGWGVWYRC